MRRRLAAHPGYRPSITSRNALGSGEGTGGFAISANILGPDLDQIADYSKRALVAAQKLPSLTEVKIGTQPLEPGSACRRRSQARRRPRRPHVDVGNILRLAVSGDDEISFYKEGPEQYPVKIRVLENQRRDIEEIGRLTVPSATGPVRIDNIARLERGLGPSTLQRSNRQFTVDADRRHRARPCARRGVQRRPPDARRAQHAADDVVQAAGAVEDPRRDDRPT